MYCSIWLSSRFWAISTHSLEHFQWSHSSYETSVYHNLMGSPTTHPEKTDLHWFSAQGNLEMPLATFTSTNSNKDCVQKSPGCQMENLRSGNESGMTSGGNELWNEFWNEFLESRNEIWNGLRMTSWKYGVHLE